MRLQEAIRLIKRGVDPAVIRDHLAGVKKHEELMDRALRVRPTCPPRQGRPRRPDRVVAQNRGDMPQETAGHSLPASGSPSGE